MDKIDIALAAGLVLLFVFVSFLVGRDANREDWCKDKGGVYISGYRA